MLSISTLLPTPIRRSSSTEFSANSGSSSQKVMNPAFLRRSWARSATMAVFPAISSWQYTSDADFGIILSDFVSSSHFKFCPLNTFDFQFRLVILESLKRQKWNVSCLFLTVRLHSLHRRLFPGMSMSVRGLTSINHDSHKPSCHMFKLTFRTKYRSHRNLTLALFSPILNSGDLPDIQYCSFCFAGTIQLPLPDLRRERRGHPGLAPGDTADL
ncbi:hypothetical protein B0H13DRAFT_2266450 [Mycena leptocephala]|nr:hypothetical protein B0H13DRAFT_2266450 [Mycena leptocephala]